MCTSTCPHAGVPWGGKGVVSKRGRGEAGGAGRSRLFRTRQRRGGGERRQGGVPRAPQDRATCPLARRTTLPTSQHAAETGRPRSVAAPAVAAAVRRGRLRSRSARRGAVPLPALHARAPGCLWTPARRALRRAGARARLRLLLRVRKAGGRGMRRLHTALRPVAALLPQSWL